jgi:outer membrane protein OmpA-like peptidoglycan-associated protein
MWRIALSLLLSTILIFPLYGQDYTTLKTTSKKTRKSFNKAASYSSRHQYTEARQLLDKALKADLKCIDVIMEQARIAYILNDQEKAIKKLEQAIALDSFYQVENLYALGMLYLEKMDPLHATGCLVRYSEEAILSEKREAQVKSKITQSEFMSTAINNPVPFNPFRLGSGINSRQDEVLPSFTVDGSKLIFTRRIEGQEDIFISDLDENGKWGVAYPLHQINTRENEGAHSVSADGRLIVFTACNRIDGYGGCDLYTTSYTNGSWSAPVNLDYPVNTPGWESQPSISADGKRLYFASNREGGKGNHDIWVAEQDRNGKWLKPVNLGPEINTKGNEEAPFIHFDNQSFYFMSDGHPGMGDYDLFFSRNINGTWEHPKNLGYPVNTPGKEGALKVDPAGRYAYFATDAKLTDHPESKNRRDQDIYRFELDESFRPKPVSYVKGKTLDADTRTPVVTTIEIFRLDEPGPSTSLATDDDGTFLTPLINGIDYGFNASAEGYLFYSDRFALAHASATKPFELEILMHPALKKDSPGIPVVLRNVYFESGSAILYPKSDYELSKLVTLLVDQPTIQIEISGHTDSVGSDEDNLLLSESRAKAVFDWLVDRGIARERLLYKGYGESQPIDTNDSELGRSNNRRTEFFIIRQ